MSSADRAYRHRHLLRRMHGFIAASVLVTIAGCSTVPLEPKRARELAAASPAPCSLSSTDEAWLNGAIAAWDYALAIIARADHPSDLQVVIFDETCQVASRTAMTGGVPLWAAKAHGGKVTLPHGSELPAQVTSFAAPATSGPFFVMAAPSVWQAAEVKSGDLTLEQLLTAVMLHEAAHVLQFPTYGSRISRLVELQDLPDNFSDDSIQEQFESEEAFASSVIRETELLLAAAAAVDRADAVRLAIEARSLAAARRERWFTGDLGYLKEAEDVWLTLEGSAQWLAYQWLIDPRGGALPPHVATREFGLRGKWWSQKQGFATFAALDRLMGPAWKKHAFGHGAKTAGELLDDALGRR